MQIMKQELFIPSRATEFIPIFNWCSHCSFCKITCLHVFNSLLWCPSWFLCKNYVWFIILTCKVIIMYCGWCRYWWSLCKIHVIRLLLIWWCFQKNLYCISYMINTVHTKQCLPNVIWLFCVSRVKQFLTNLYTFSIAIYAITVRFVSVMTHVF